MIDSECMNEMRFFNHALLMPFVLVESKVANTRLV